MSFEVNITVNDTATLDRLAQVESVTRNPTGIGLVAAEETKKFLVAHTGSVEWKGDHYLAGDFPGIWLDRVEAAWKEPEIINGETILIRNDDATFHHKVLGGTITAKNVANLTIPIVAEAKGYSAREYEIKTGNKLFPVKGVLAIKDPSDPKGILPIYALRPSVTQAPWPQALPEDADIASNFLTAFQEALGEALGASSVFASAGSIAEVALSA